MDKNRKIKAPKYRSFRLQKKIKIKQAKLPSVWSLFRQTFGTFKRNKKYFLVFVAVYMLLNFFFVQSGISPVAVQKTKEALSSQAVSDTTTNVALYSNLVSNSAQPNTPGSTMYQVILMIVFGLALIYALRQMGSRQEKVTFKESIYKGMTSVVPLVLVLVVLAIEIIPMSIGASLYATVIASGLAVTNIEKLIWLLLFLLLTVLSLFLLVNSIMAVFIVTLPDMTPVRALKAAKDLVRFRKLKVLRKALFLPLALVITLGILVVPFIAWLPIVASIIFFFAASFVLPISVTYMYNLYKSLL